MSDVYDKFFGLILDLSRERFARLRADAEAATLRRDCALMYYRLCRAERDCHEAQATVCAYVVREQTHRAEILELKSDLSLSEKLVDEQALKLSEFQRRCSVGCPQPIRSVCRARCLKRSRVLETLPRFLLGGNPAASPPPFPVLPRI